MNKIFNSRPWLIIEPVILLVVFGLLARELTPLWGVAPGAADLALSASPPDWRALAILDGKSLLIKWGMLIASAALLASLRGYNIFRPIAGECPSLSFAQLVLLGLVVAIPLHVMSVLPRWYHFNVAPLGEAPPIWALLYGSTWTLEFWAFMAVSSFLLVPIVEELFFRGYFLGSLAKVFSPFWAIVLSAAVFAAMHLQYAALDAFALYNMAMVFTMSAVYAWTVFATRSLIPAIVGHAYGNFPQPLEWAPYQSLLIIPALIVVFMLMRARHSTFDKNVTGKPPGPLR